MEEATIIPIVLAITEAIKRLGLDTKFTPFVSIAVGIALSLVVTGLEVANIIPGIIYGLSASGLYSGGKSVLK